jgi:hypothetical protein
MYSRYCFSRSNFLIELVAGIGGAFLCGVPGIIIGSFYGSVYPEISWGGLTGEAAGGMLGLLLSAAVGGWLMVYFFGQLIHDHRSGIVSFAGAVLGTVTAIFLFDYSYQSWFTVFILMLPAIVAAFGYNLPVVRDLPTALASFSPVLSWPSAPRLVTKVSSRARPLRRSVKKIG